MSNPNQNPEYVSPEVIDRHMQTVRELLHNLAGCMLLEAPNGVELAEQYRRGDLDVAVTYLAREAAVTLTVFDTALDREPTPLVAWSLKSLVEAGIIVSPHAGTH